MIGSDVHNLAAGVDMLAGFEEFDWGWISHASMLEAGETLLDTDACQVIAGGVKLQTIYHGTKLRSKLCTCMGQK